MYEDMNKEYLLDKFFSGNKQIPTVPAIYLKFSKMIEESSVASNKEIADLITKDPAMVVKILKLSNSALYARRSEITSLTSAVTLLGIETLKNLILKISLVRAFKFDDKELPEFNISTFWEHSLATAYFAPLIVKKMKIPPNDNYYIGGLLHDIGKLVIFQFYPEKFKEIILTQVKENVRDTEAEETVFGVNHCDIGGYFAEQWKFKKEIVDVIKNHHNVTGSISLNVAITRLSNLFSKAVGLCFPWDSNFFDLVGDPTWEVLSLYTDENVNIEEMILEIMEESGKIKESVTELLREND